MIIDDEINEQESLPSETKNVNAASVSEKSDSSIKECAPNDEPIDDENDIDKEFANFTIEKIDEELKKCREMQKKLLRAKKRKMTGKKRSFKK